jgi:hypothetical protein
MAVQRQAPPHPPPAEADPYLNINQVAAGEFARRTWLSDAEALGELGLLVNRALARG